MTGNALKSKHYATFASNLYRPMFGNLGLKTQKTILTLKSFRGYKMIFQKIKRISRFEEK